MITLRGWGNREISQQAFFHNMPLAIASALEFPEYVELNVAGLEKPGLFELLGIEEPTVVPT